MNLMYYNFNDFNKEQSVQNKRRTTATGAINDGRRSRVVPETRLTGVVFNNAP